MNPTAKLPWTFRLASGVAMDCDALLALTVGLPWLAAGSKPLTLPPRGSPRPNPLAPARYLLAAAAVGLAAMAIARERVGGRRYAG